MLQTNAPELKNFDGMEGITTLTRRLRGRVAIVGDFMLDEYVFGTVRRISPEAPVPVVEAERKSYVVGGAGNVLMNVRALGGEPVPLGFVGADENGTRLVDMIGGGDPGASVHVIADSSRPTTVKRRIIAHSQQLIRIDVESREPVPEDLTARMLAKLGDELPRLEAVVVSDYAKGGVTRPVFDQIVRMCAGSHIPLLLDPKVFELDGIGPVTVITPNEREPERHSGIRIHDDFSAERAGRALVAQTGAENVLITRGPDGMDLFSAGGGFIHLATEARQVYDVTGAGDTVIATLSLALAAGAEMPDAARLANLAAGLVVAKLGTATVTAAELEAALGGKWPLESRSPSVRGGVGVFGETAAYAD